VETFIRKGAVVRSAYPGLYYRFSTAGPRRCAPRIASIAGLSSWHRSPFARTPLVRIRESAWKVGRRPFTPGRAGPNPPAESPLAWVLIDPAYERDGPGFRARSLRCSLIAASLRKRVLLAWYPNQEEQKTHRESEPAAGAESASAFSAS